MEVYCNDFQVFFPDPRAEPPTMPGAGGTRLLGTHTPCPAQRPPGSKKQGYYLGVVTLKLRLDLPGAGSEPTKHVAVMVLKEHHAGPLLGDVPTELGKAVPMELRREQQTPAVLQHPGQVGVDVDDRQDVQDALKLPALVDLTLRDQGGQTEGQVQQEKAPVDDHAQEGGHMGGPEHPVLDHGVVTVTVQPLRPQELLAV